VRYCERERAISPLSLFKDSAQSDTAVEETKKRDGAQLSYAGHQWRAVEEGCASGARRVRIGLERL